MSQYVLCSSSSEEDGEVTTGIQQRGPVVDTACIFTRSLYHGTLFVGKRSKISPLRIPFSEMKAEHVRGRLKRAKPYSFVLSFCSLLEVPAHGTSSIKKAEAIPGGFFLLKEEKMLRELGNVGHCQSLGNIAAELPEFAEKCADDESVSSFRRENGICKVVFVRDTTLENLCSHWVSICVTEAEAVRKIWIQGFSLEGASLGEAIRHYGEFCVERAAGSKECRVYACAETLIVIFSLSVFLRGDREYRLHKMPDLPKNCDVIVEDGGIHFVDGYDEGLVCEMATLNGLDLDSGEYVLHGNDIYARGGGDVLRHGPTIDFAKIPGSSH